MDDENKAAAVEAEPAVELVEAEPAVELVELDPVLNLVGIEGLGPVPDTVSRGQFVLALQLAGLLPDTMAAIDRGLPAVDGGEDFAGLWVSLADIRLNSKFAAVLGAALGLSQDLLENLFRVAARIET